MDADHLKPVYRWLHILLGIIGSAASVLLATAKGHPPGLVFVPIVFAIWFTGHGLLWLSRKLAVKGQLAASNHSVGDSKWPILLILLVCLFGTVFIFGAFGLAWQVFSGSRSGIGQNSMIAIWLTTSLCFFGILLRQDWSRVLAGRVFMFVAAILLYEMVASAMRGYRNSTTEWVMVIVIFIILVLFGLYVLRSSKIKAFYSGGSH